MSSNPSDEEIRQILERWTRVAVVGLSEKPDRPSYDVAAYLQRVGYEIVPVNPLIESSLGVEAVATLAGVPGPVEIVDVFRRPEHVPPIVDDAIAVGARVLWLQLGIVNEQAAARARSAGLVVVQDRCMAVEHRRLLDASARRT